MTKPTRPKQAKDNKTARMTKTEKGSAQKSTTKERSLRTKAKSAEPNKKDECQSKTTGCRIMRVLKRPPPPTQTHHVHDLPDHFMAAVFRMMTMRQRVRIERVSRRWRAVARQAAWWNVTEFSYTQSMFVCDPSKARSPANPSAFERTFYNEYSSAGLLALIRRCGPFISRFDLSGLRDRTDSGGVSKMIPHCSSTLLTELDLTGIQLTNRCLLTIGDHLGKSLRRLTLSRCSLLNRALSRLLERCVNLEQLDLSENESLETITDLPLTLTLLNVSGCDRLSMEAIETFTHCRRLKELNMDRMDFLQSRFPFQTAALKTRFNDFLRSMNQLEVFKMNRCLALTTNTGLLNGLKGMTSLTRLYLNDNAVLDDQGVQAIADGCHSLQKLSLRGPTRISGPGSFDCLAQLRQLTALNLSAQPITDETMRALFINGRLWNLTTLVLTFCELITDESIAVLRTMLQNSTKERARPDNCALYVPLLASGVTRNRGRKRSDTGYYHRLLKADYETHTHGFDQPDDNC